MKKLREDLADNQAYRALFRKEYEKGTSLSHPNVVKYESLHNSTNGCYILMENIVGDTLDEHIKNHPDYFKSRTNRNKFFNQLLDGLKYLHKNHVVFSDLKPQNIMITQVNSDVKIIDLGFCFTDSYPDSSGTTTGFSAPEHISNGKLDVTTDIYCLGRLIEYISKHSDGPLPRKYRSIMNKCLQYNKCDRYQSVDEIIQKINSHKRQNITLLSIVAIILLGATWGIGKSSLAPDNNSIWNDTLTLDFIKYSHFNDIDSSCEIVGADSTSNLYFVNEVRYKRKIYTVTQVADSAFYDCNNIISVYIPHGIKRIGSYAFIRCLGLSSINLPNSIEELGECAFWGCKSVKQVRLSSGLKEINSACFAGHSSSYISIPEGVERICLDAFAINDCLTSVSFPSTLRFLERGAFFDCSSLTEITIPANVEILGEYIFFGCENLTHIYNQSPTPQQILPIHKNPSQITLHVPAEAVEAYRNAPNWREMNIVAIEADETE